MRLKRGITSFVGKTRTYIHPSIHRHGPWPLLNNVHYSTEIKIDLEIIKAELKSNYKNELENIKRSSDFEARTVDLNEIYVNTDIMEIDEYRAKKFQFDHQMELDEKSKKPPPQPIETLFGLDNNKNQKRKHQLITGGSGMGKSLLCKYILAEWSKDKPNEHLTQFDWVFLIPLRKLTKAVNYSDTSVAKVLKEVGFGIKKINGFNDAYKQITQENDKVLYMLDAFDESNIDVTTQGPKNTDDKNSPNILADLLEQENVLVTSRFYSVPDLYANHQFEMMGFNDDNINEFIKQYFDKQYSNKTGIKNRNLTEYLRANPSIKEMARTPFILELLCKVWKAPQKMGKEDLNPVTKTELYALVEDYMLRRHIQEKKGKPTRHLSDEKIRTNKEVENRRDLLKELAYTGQRDQTTDLTYNMINRQNKSTMDQLLDALTLGLLHSTDETEILPHKSFHFPHSSFQEYFAALKWADMFTSSNMIERIDAYQTLKEHKYNPYYFEFWRFAAGILKENSDCLDLFFQTILSEPRDLAVAYEFALVINCLEESRQKSKSKLLTNISNQLSTWLNGIDLSSETQRKLYKLFVLFKNRGYLSNISEMDDNTLNRINITTDMETQSKTKHIKSLLNKLNDDSEKVQLSSAIMLGKLNISSTKIVDIFVKSLNMPYTRWRILHTDYHDVLKYEAAGCSIMGIFMAVMGNPLSVSTFIALIMFCYARLNPTSKLLGMYEYKSSMATIAAQLFSTAPYNKLAEIKLNNSLSDTDEELKIKTLQALHRVKSTSLLTSKCVINRLKEISTYDNEESANMLAKAVLCKLIVDSKKIGLHKNHLISSIDMPIDTYSLKFVVNLKNALANIMTVASLNRVPSALTGMTLDNRDRCNAGKMILFSWELRTVFSSIIKTIVRFDPLSDTDHELINILLLKTLSLHSPLYIHDKTVNIFEKRQIYQEHLDPGQSKEIQRFIQETSYRYIKPIFKTHPEPKFLQSFSPQSGKSVYFCKEVKEFLHRYHSLLTNVKDDANDIRRENDLKSQNNALVSDYLDEFFKLEKDLISCYGDIKSRYDTHGDQLNQNQAVKSQLDIDIVRKAVYVLSRDLRALSKFPKLKQLIRNSLTQVNKILSHDNFKILSTLNNDNIETTIHNSRSALMNDSRASTAFNNTLANIVNELSEPITCFISYAWPILDMPMDFTNEEIHNDELWLQQFLDDLHADLTKIAPPYYTVNKVSPTLDIVDNDHGRSIIQFVDKIHDNDYVILIMTESLLQKYNEGVSIVCSELNLISESIQLGKKLHYRDRVLPILLSGNETSSVPPQFRKYTTYRDWRNKSYASCVKDLVRNLMDIDKRDDYYQKLWQPFEQEHGEIHMKPFKNKESQKPPASGTNRNRHFSTYQQHKSITSISSSNSDHDHDTIRKTN